MASTYLTKTFSAGNRKTGTISVWLKRSSLDATQYIFSAMNAPANGYISSFINIESSGKIALKNFTADGTSTHTELKHNASLYDVSAWYHIVFSWNTTLSTASDRYKLYVNGERITSFSTATYPTLNEDLYFDIGGSSNPVSIGSENSGGGGGYFSGSMSHYHHTDGTAYDASAFGETDATTGEWKIKTSPSVTYGTNGFFILKDGNSVTDQSGQGNNFTANGNLIKSEDCPSNVFATMNPLDNFYAGGTFINGNNTITTSNSTNNVTPLISTLGMSSGKYYAEIKYSARTGADDFARIGVCASNASRPVNEGFEGMITDHSYQGSDGAYGNNDSHNSGYGATYTVGDIIGIALDLDNGYIYFSKNGTYQNSGVPTSGSTGTGGKTVSLGVDYFFGVADIDYNDSYTFQCNFGNGFFGTTAVSSAGTNASGNGIFEYDTPTGYTALSTKGLNL